MIWLTDALNYIFGDCNSVNLQCKPTVTWTYQQSFRNELFMEVYYCVIVPIEIELNWIHRNFYAENSY